MKTRSILIPYREFKVYIFQSRKRLAGFMLLILLPSLAILILNLLSSLNYMRMLSSQPLTKTENINKKSTAQLALSKPGKPVLDPKLVSLQVAELFWKNRLKMAKKDSIGLVVDLLDSVVSIDIRGVPVRECRIQSYEISSILRYVRDRGALIPWIRESFILEDYWATLPKAPIKIKEAPADTNEAKEMIDASLPVEKQDVRFILQFNRNLVLQIDQTEPFVFTGWFEKHFRNLQFHLEKGIKFIYTLVKFDWPEPELRIRIRLSQSDAKAIFRALPHKAEAVIRL